MNPLSNVKAITRMNKLELEMGLNSKSSWHNKYRDSAWIFVGGLPYELTEGDIVCVFSQYGELVNINLVRDKTTGKSKGYCFICYEDQRSTILAVDNFNGIKLLTRTLRVDHVENYRQPKEDEHIDEITKKVRSEGIAPKLSSSGSEKEGSDYDDQVKKVKKEKKARKKEGKEKKKKKRSSGDHDSEERILKPEVIKTDLKISQSKERDSRSYRNRIDDMDDSHDQMKPLNYSQGNDGRNERIRPRNENYYTDKVFSRKGEDNYYKNPIKERGIKRYREPSREADMNRNYNRDRNWVNTNWDRRREMNRGRDRNREYYDRKRPRW